MPRRKGTKNQPRIGGYSSFRGDRLEPAPQFAFVVNEQIFGLARQMARCHSFWPEGYPLPEALGCFDPIPCVMDRNMCKTLTLALLSRTCHRLDSFIRRFKGHEAGLANVNIRGRCDSVFYGGETCTCIVSGYPKSCLESIVPSDALPLVLKESNGELRDFYPDSMKNDFPRYFRKNGMVYPYILPEGYFERNMRNFIASIPEEPKTPEENPQS